MWKQWALAISFLIFCAATGSVFAKHGGGRSPASSPSLGGFGGGPKALEVKGQTRSLNMMQTTQAEKDQINFVRLRRNYRNEIRGTTY